MFFIWMLLPALYIGSRFIWWLPLSPVLRFGLFLVLVGICEFRFFSRWLWWSSFSPEWPRPVVMLAGGLFGAVDRVLRSDLPADRREADGPVRHFRL